ncbi:MAG: recombinase family protein [Sarcina sp.]
MEKNIKVAIYCRVSTVEQAEEGYSIDEQDRLLREYCEKNNYTIYKTYSDRGISGKNIEKRNALKELLRDASEKEPVFNMVIVWKINRISRKLSDTLKIVEVLKANDIAFKSYSEKVETETPAGKMQFQMMAMVAEFERGTIAQNVKMGMTARAREGRWCGNKVFGYDLIERADTTNKKRSDKELIINRGEADIVKRIFTEYSVGKGYKAIVNGLNKDGFKTKKGNAFAVTSVRDILKNPVYVGKIRYNFRENCSEGKRGKLSKNPIIVEGIHKAIISEELWHKVEILLEAKRGKPSRIYDGEYPLTGIMKCPKCGAGMVIMRTTNKLKDGSKKRIAYYACGNWKNKGTAVCNANTIRVDESNQYVYAKISALLSSDKLLNKIVKELNKDRKTASTPIIKELQTIAKELEKLNKKKKKVFELLEDDIIDREDFRMRNQEIKEAVLELNERKEILNSKMSNGCDEEISFDFIKSIVSNFADMYNKDISRENRKLLLHMLIKEIEIEDKSVKEIKLNIDSKLVNYLEMQEGMSVIDVPSSFVLQGIGGGGSNVEITMN